MSLPAFSPLQWMLIIIIAAVFAVGLVANIVLLCFMHNRRKKRKMCNKQLQRQRDGLVKELKNLSKGAPPSSVSTTECTEPVVPIKPAPSPAPASASVTAPAPQTPVASVSPFAPVKRQPVKEKVAVISAVYIKPDSNKK